MSYRAGGSAAIKFALGHPDRLLGPEVTGSCSTKPSFELPRRRSVSEVLAGTGREAVR